MIVKLLTKHHLEFLSLKEGYTGSPSLHLSKYHIVGNHMSRLNYLHPYFVDASSKASGESAQTCIFAQACLSLHCLTM